MRAVFLDRDGVINENRPDHVKCWAEFRFLPGALDAIRRLTEAGLLICVVTNQAVINRGLVPRVTVDAINRQMVSEIERHGGRIAAVAYCPHRPEERCRCRKPQPGLILDLMARYRLEPHECVVIGDALSDLDAGRAAGVASILVRTGRGREQLALALAGGRFGLTVAADLPAAVDHLLPPAGAFVWSAAGGGT
jgi:D-glycero-D-manno-heptose 1,7-bisphosphate phosphatase